MLSTIFKALLKFFFPFSQPPRPPQPPQPPQQQPPSDDEYYLGLRSRANEEGDAMAQSFEQSHQAYSRGDKAGAKMLSNRGKEHQRKMEGLNKQASDWIFTENNKGRKPGHVDLHGLYVKEAIAHTDQAIEEAKRRGDSELHLIVGKGLHSKGGAAKVGPAIKELMRKHQLLAEFDPHNAGVLVVQISSYKGKGVGPDEIARRLERNDGDCTIM